MKKTIFILSVLSILYTGCDKPYNCDNTVETGESVMLPVRFEGFFLSEINNIRVYRTNAATPTKTDTFFFSKIMWGYSAHSDKEHFTDRAQDGNLDPNYSYLDNCTLILDWQTKRDTLSNFVIKKSKYTTRDKCHKDDPLIKLDEVSYVYKGKTIYTHKGGTFNLADTGIVITK